MKVCVGGRLLIHKEIRLVFVLPVRCFWGGENQKRCRRSLKKGVKQVRNGVRRIRIRIEGDDAYRWS